MTDRRELLKLVSASLLGRAATRAQTAQNRRILFFTRCSNADHPVLQRGREKLSFAERILMEIGERDGISVECSKDGSVFANSLAAYGGVVFFNSGDPAAPARDGSPPVTSAGFARLLDAIEGGKFFIGIHSAATAFAEQKRQADAYTAMLGARYLGHGAPQEASLFAASNFLARAAGVPGEGLSFTDEWCTFRDFSRDLHVILVQETRYLKGSPYRRPDYPCTWARRHGNGRVFYTSLGHRQDMWSNPFFHAILQAGLAWGLGSFQFDVKPNIETAAPQAWQTRS